MDKKYKKLKIVLLLFGFTSISSMPGSALRRSDSAGSEGFRTPRSARSVSIGPAEVYQFDPSEGAESRSRGPHTPRRSRSPSPRVRTVPVSASELASGSGSGRYEGQSSGRSSDGRTSASSILSPQVEEGRTALLRLIPDHVSPEAIANIERALTETSLSNDDLLWIIKEYLQEGMSEKGADTILRAMREYLEPVHPASASGSGAIPYSGRNTTTPATSSSSSGAAFRPPARSAANNSLHAYESWNQGGLSKPEKWLVGYVQVYLMRRSAIILENKLLKECSEKGINPKSSYGYHRDPLNCQFIPHELVNPRNIFKVPRSKNRYSFDMAPFEIGLIDNRIVLFFKILLESYFSVMQLVEGKMSIERSTDIKTRSDAVEKAERRKLKRGLYLFSKGSAENFSFIIVDWPEDSYFSRKEIEEYIARPKNESPLSQIQALLEWSHGAIGSDSAY